MVNGERVSCRGLAKDVAICIGEEYFTVDCYNIPLDCYDMVLVVSFLCIPGLILWVKRTASLPEMHTLCLHLEQKLHAIFVDSNINCGQLQCVLIFDFDTFTSVDATIRTETMGLFFPCTSATGVHLT